MSIVARSVDILKGKAPKIMSVECRFRIWLLAEVYQ